MSPHSSSTISNERLALLLSRERLGAYLDRCDGLSRGIELYRWNADASAAFWRPLGHVEVALRNAMSESLAARHRRLERAGSWLDDPAAELDARMAHGATPAASSSGASAGSGAKQRSASARAAALWRS